jgi:NitT/TauT family transport system substrate-binding protein
MNNLQTRLRLAAALAFCVLGCSATLAQQPVEKVRFAFTSKSITPANVDVLIPEYLGYFKAEGLSVEPLALGSYGTALAAVDTKRVEFVSLTPDYMLGVVSRDTKLPVLNFFESTYPFKYAIAVKPGSSIKSLSDLKGRTIGIPTADQKRNAYSLIKVAGLDPDKDVSWLATGEGIPSGVALERGRIDALFAYDVIFGTIEGAGMHLTYLPLPDNLPQIGGTFVSARPDFLRDKRRQAVGLARGIAKAHVFIQQNPRAAAYIFAQMYPEATPKGKSPEEQVAAMLSTVQKRAPLYSPLNRSIAKWGYMEEKDWIDTAGVLGLPVPKLSNIYTNSLIDDINSFDTRAIKTEAHNFKIPHKS